MVGYVGVGLAYARWTLPANLDAKPIGDALAGLRSALAHEEGYAVIENAPPGLRPLLDLWGAAPATLLLMRSLKAQWDPQHILNRGRYIGGI
jgi:glycolate oxidase FAD binding subunit